MVKCVFHKQCDIIISIKLSEVSTYLHYLGAETLTWIVRKLRSNIYLPHTRINTDSQIYSITTDSSIVVSD